MLNIQALLITLLVNQMHILFHILSKNPMQYISTFSQGAYPARLKKVLIVTAPLWFKAPFKILRLFVREKLRDRVSKNLF